jgi:hypothetical protein
MEKIARAMIEIDVAPASAGGLGPRGSPAFSRRHVRLREVHGLLDLSAKTPEP